jgi:glycerophosphoryl diester phosphodiesterase
MPARFELQGHRGARGLKPENTLPSFEAALDAGVTSIETDVHLTRNGVPVLIHDPVMSRHLWWPRRGRHPSTTHPALATEPLVSSLELVQLRGYLARRHPDHKRFPDQQRSLTPLARRYSNPYVLQALRFLFVFVEAYAGELGAETGKTVEQRERASRVLFDLELKRVPYHPQVIGDDFDNKAPGLLEQRVVEEIRKAGMVGRTRVRSFDHRSVRAIRQLEPRIQTAVLIAETAPVNPAGLAKSARAGAFCPDYRFLDALQVKQCHAAGVRVLPWTVNEEPDWLRLIDWGVDGITTDYPDRLATLLRSRGIEF